MAINFPNPPLVDGNTYEYLGIVYSWKETAPGGSDGYWEVTTPGTYGIATSAEINTGLDTVKYITPAELDTSKYISTDDEAPGAYGTAHDKYVSPDNMRVSNYKQWVQYNVDGEEVLMYTKDQAGGFIQDTSFPFYIFGARRAIIRLWGVPALNEQSTSDTFYVWPDGTAYNTFPFAAHYLTAVPTTNYNSQPWTDQFTMAVPANGKCYVRWTQVSTEGIRIYALGYWY